MVACGLAVAELFDFATWPSVRPLAGALSYVSLPPFLPVAKCFLAQHARYSDVRLASRPAATATFQLFCVGGVLSPFFENYIVFRFS